MSLTERICSALESGDLFDPHELPLSRQAKQRYAAAALKTELACMEWMQAHPGATLTDGAIAEAFKIAAGITQTRR